MPKISIIVPIYNTEKYLTDCINSVVNQTFVDFELLLINDGSIDNSETICRDFVAKDDRIKLFNKANGGQPSALNYGIDRATGDYLMFLDADDYWCDNEILSKLYTTAETNNLDIVRGECQEVNNLGEVLTQYSGGKYKEEYCNKVIDSVFLLDKIADRKYFMVLYLIKRESLGKLRYNIKRVFLQDAELNLTLCSQCLRCMYIPEVFYAYRKHDDAITVKPHPQKLHDAFDFSRFCFKLSQENVSPQMKLFCVKEGINNFLFDLSVIAVGWSWSDIIDSFKKYDLYGIRKEASHLLYVSKLRGKLRICYLPLPIIMLFYKFKYLVHNCRKALGGV